MTREQALRRLKRVLGPKAYWRIAEGVSSPEKRERYHARRQAAHAQRKAAADALEARKVELLAADAEYQARLAIYHTAKEVDNDVRYRDGESGYKFSVGIIDLGMFRVQRAEGDTWEEIFAQLEPTKGQD